MRCDATLDRHYAVDRLLYQGRRNDLFTRLEGMDETARMVVLEVPDRLSNESAGIMGRNGPMAEPEVLETFWQILSGTRAMHDAGIVHRHLRPRNVRLERREGHPPLVKLIDFASARSRARC